MPKRFPFASGSTPPVRLSNNTKGGPFRASLQHHSLMKARFA
jgi:hypothetical protein